jgi:hypothetical protein
MVAGDDVVLCGAWDEGPGYPRTTALRQGLLAAGQTVRECRAPGLGTGKQRLLRAPWRWPLALWQQRRQRAQLADALQATIGARRPRCVIVPYPGHGTVRTIAAASDVPVVLDLFLSAYDTVVEDRRLVAPGSLGAWWLQQLDTKACAAADLVLLDTPENAAYTAALTGLPPERFAWMPVADPESVTPVPLPPLCAGQALRVLFFGTGVPLHGLSTLVDAIARVHGVQLTLVGGTAAERAHAVAVLGERLDLQPEFVDRAALARHLEQGHVVAGIFGDSGKAQRVVPFKLVHALAAGRPVLTADTPAVCHWLDGSDALFLAPAADIAALVHALQQLVAAPARVAIAAAAARAAYDRHFGTARQAERWRELLQRLPARAARGNA